MNLHMKTIITLGLLLFSGISYAQDQECMDFIAAEKVYANKLPIQIDEITTVVQLTVNCSTKIVKYVKRVEASSDDMAEGFRYRKQRQHLNLHCNNQGIASLGWTVWDYIYDRDMQLLMKLEATPAMCSDR
jgi:hypothetical protein